MTGSCAKNGVFSACKTCTDMDSRGAKEKGTSTHKMEKDDTGIVDAGSWECWYLLG